MPTEKIIYAYTLAELEAAGGSAYENALNLIAEVEAGFIVEDISGMLADRLTEWGLGTLEAYEWDIYRNYLTLRGCTVRPDPDVCPSPDGWLSLTSRHSDYGVFAVLVPGDEQGDDYWITSGPLYEAVRDWWYEQERDLLGAARATYEDAMSEEAIRDLAEANGWLFSEDGRRFL